YQRFICLTLDRFYQALFGQTQNQRTPRADGFGHDVASQRFIKIEITCPHLLCPLCLHPLGLKCETRFNSSYKRRSSWLTSFGTVIFKRTYSSPRPPLRLFKPWPRRRKRCPLFAPEGIVNSTLPSIVGTSTFAPRTASHG